MSKASVRYFVDDVDAAVAFYTEHLGVERLRGAGARFRNDIVQGFGGKQVLMEDPSGNPIELFQPPES